jgi:hypothetical protein
LVLVEFHANRRFPRQVDQSPHEGPGSPVGPWQLRYC